MSKFYNFNKHDNYNKNNNKFQNKYDAHDENEKIVNNETTEEINNEAVEETKEINKQEVNNTEEPKEDNKRLFDTNYLEFSKNEEQKENLVEDGVVYKHGIIINCNTLNFREEPNKGAKIIGTFKLGDEILFSETPDQDWYYVKNSLGQKGYCMSEYIKIEV